MAKLTIYGASDGSVEFEGAIFDEFYLGADRVWAGNLKTPEGDTVTLRASYCVDNPEGWEVKIVGATLTSNPWPYRRESQFHDESGTKTDHYIIIDVPPNVTVESLSG